MVHLGNEWDEILKDEFQSDYYKRIRYFLKKEYKEQTIYPPMDCIFNALKYTAYSDVKAVLLGQDPYHEPGQAHGLCFSVQPGVEPPPSLKNIFRELESDLGIAPPVNGTLTKWARQGVLLLNASLTVREHQPKSHSGIGWERFTEAAVRLLAEQRDHLVFLLWGSDAIRRGDFIDRSRHLVMTCVHPSPLSASRGFFGNHQFTRANEYLVAHGKTPIVW